MVSLWSSPATVVHRLETQHRVPPSKGWSLVRTLYRNRSYNLADRWPSQTQSNLPQYFRRAFGLCGDQDRVTHIDACRISITRSLAFRTTRSGYPRRLRHHSPARRGLPLLPCGAAIPDVVGRLHRREEEPGPVAIGSTAAIRHIHQCRTPN